VEFFKIDDLCFVLTRKLKIPYLQRLWS